MKKKKEAGGWQKTKKKRTPNGKQQSSHDQQSRTLGLGRLGASSSGHDCPFHFATAPSVRERAFAFPSSTPDVRLGPPAAVRSNANLPLRPLLSCRGVQQAKKKKKKRKKEKKSKTLTD
jgi:hypothetical protein